MLGDIAVNYAVAIGYVIFVLSASKVIGWKIVLAVSFISGVIFSYATKHDWSDDTLRDNFKVILASGLLLAFFTVVSLSVVVAAKWIIVRLRA